MARCLNGNELKGLLYYRRGVDACDLITFFTFHFNPCKSFDDNIASAKKRHYNVATKMAIKAGLKRCYGLGHQRASRRKAALS
jgi:hypothetical protein